MCAIAGMIELMGIDRQDYQAVLDTMRHRGPDQTGVYRSNTAVLLHARLSVVDLEHGKQPMTQTKNEQHFTLVYNGELYNTEEIRADLRAQGVTFEGHSDTEVLLKSYLHWGEDCLARFNGIYAFAIWDELHEELFFARDRMGVKPFFYAMTDDCFRFASEIKSLLALGIEPVVDRTGVAELLFVGPGRTAGCGVFREVQELKAGCCGRFSKNGLAIRRYWTLQDRTHPDNFEQTVERVRWLVTDAIQKQLVSDVPIGCFLSGGLDSSLICAVAAEHLREQGEQLQTFSVTYEDQEKHFKRSKFQHDTDDQAIAVMTAFLGSKHHTEVLAIDDLVQALYRAVDARDLPGMADVDSSLWLFCGRIKQRITVGLSGECADEIFGGYPWYRDPTIRATDGFPWAQSTAYRQIFLQDRYAIDGARDIDERYRASLAEVQKMPLLSDTERRMREMSHLNFNWFMQTLLDRKDRMSMAQGLEVRVPFCDHRIVEYLYSVPWEWKDYNQTEKGLLRQAMQGVLPDSVLWRKKNPYPKTHNPAYLQAVSQALQKLLDRKDAPIWQMIKPDACRRLLDDNNAVPWYGQLMTTPQTIAYFLQLNYWMEHYQVKLV